MVQTVRFLRAEAGLFALVVAVHKTTRASQITLNMLMVAFLNVSYRSLDRSLGPTQRTGPSPWFFAHERSCFGHSAGRSEDGIFVGSPWRRYALPASCVYLCGSRRSTQCRGQAVRLHRWSENPKTLGRAMRLRKIFKSKSRFSPRCLFSQPEILFGIFNEIACDKEPLPGKRFRDRSWQA
jgi:hypothetical protein